MEEIINSLANILKHDPELLKKVFDSVPAGISITTDITCRDIKHNKKAAEFLRIQPGEVFSETASGSLPFRAFYESKELSPEEMPIQRAVLQGESVKEQKIDLYWEDGKHKTAVWNAIPLLDENGAIAGAVAAFEDITERRELAYFLKEHQEHLEELVIKRTWEVELGDYQLKRENIRRTEVEEELRKKNEEISIILESVTDSFFALDNEWKFTYANEEAKKYFFNEDVLGKNIWSLIPDARGSIFWDNYHKVMLDREPVHFEAKTIYSKIWVAGHVYPFQEGISILFRDISERKQLEKELKEEEERWLITFMSCGDGIITADMEGRVDKMNSAAETLTGWRQEEEAKGTPLAEVFYIINEQTRQRCENPVEKVLAAGKIIGLANSTVLISRDGEEMVLTDSATPIDDCEGNIYGVILVFQDITKRVKMEKEMARLDRLNLNRNRRN
ncbi:MAG TPA: hypothetical protein DEH07_05750 [Desulfotomaculum sp.]|nr:MAG: Uncharacterized protein XD84_2005 [Desulfotomaculum sp. 46_80]HBY04043.1 hypothetical protein [Desulfotomaculum sp.]